jgi:3-oxoacyl-[acyl-carrier protein] reductase
MEPLTGQTAVVTGGANGVGRGIALILAREGARVAIADIDLAAAEAVAGELTEEGHAALAVAVDVTDATSTRTMAATVCVALGPVTILAANAGIYPPVRLDEMDDAAWDRVMDINVKGALHAIQACLPSMLETGYGRIALTSSVTGPITGYPGFAHYGASKAAMLGMMRSIALEVVARGITINAVLPGNVLTEGLRALGEEHTRRMVAAIPMGELVEPEDVGWAVRFLASHEARRITGQTLVVDGGQVLPESPEAMIDD